VVNRPVLDRLIATETTFSSGPRAVFCRDPDWPETCPRTGEQLRDRRAVVRCAMDLAVSRRDAFLCSCRREVAGLAPVSGESAGNYEPTSPNGISSNQARQRHCSTCF